MKILLIKLSSMGDIIHTLPALSDAMAAIPGFKVDWVIDKAFSDIPTWHPAINKIIPVSLREWKKNIFSRGTAKGFFETIKTLNQQHYDLIIDAQGLLKSAIVAKVFKGKIAGFDKNSVREKIASYFYNEKYSVNKDTHAIDRLRILLSKALHYPLPNTPYDFCINTQKFPALSFTLKTPYFVFLHNTTWKTKLYPEPYWEKLIRFAESNHIFVYLPWGNENEKARAERLAKQSDYAQVLPKLSITEMAIILANAKHVVSIDTGFAHLSAALQTPTIVLYGPTDAKRLGIAGKNQLLLQADFPCSPCNSRECLYAKTHKVDVMPPCFESIGPEAVWAQLYK